MEIRPDPQTNHVLLPGNDQLLKPKKEYRAESQGKGKGNILPLDQLLVCCKEFLVNFLL
jgi:hypothetical protein